MAPNKQDLSTKGIKKYFGTHNFVSYIIRCRKTRVSDCTSSTVIMNQNHRLILLYSFLVMKKLFRKNRVPITYKEILSQLIKDTFKCCDLIVIRYKDSRQD